MSPELQEAADVGRKALERSGFQVIEEVESPRGDELLLGVLTPTGQPMNVTVSLTE